VWLSNLRGRGLLNNRPHDSKEFGAFCFCGRIIQPRRERRLLRFCWVASAFKMAFVGRLDYAVTP
jgi:hypothetical protein